MIFIKVKDGENINSALKRFNTAVLEDGILKELKTKAHYEKPSVKKRRIKKQRQMEQKNNVK